MTDQNVNPANEIKAGEIPPDFIPMSTGVQRLQVPKRDGFVRYWFRDEPGRIQRAQQAGYRFVRPEDASLNNFDLGGDAKDSGNTDLGTRVSVISGDGVNPANGNQPNRLYLMEVPVHLWELSQKVINDRNDQTARALTNGMVGTDNMSQADKRNMTVNAKLPDFFNPHKTRRPE